jgi:hypothetical protein
MKKAIINSAILLCIMQLTYGQGNPFVRDIYTADPSAHVWDDGRLYVYPSHDVSPPRQCDLMDKYHVYSTDDMQNWTDHGQILEANDVPWAQPLANGGKFMWAPDCAYKNGKYYFYFPHPDKDPWNDNWKIGIAVSEKPASDFTVLDEPLKGLPAKGMIDPCVFIDDDGQAYFYYGGGGRCQAGKLKDNMIELDGELKTMTGLLYFHEGAWVHKKGDIYYLSYPGNSPNLPNYVAGQDQLLYAISNSPLGPWDYKGSYLSPTGCDTSHGSIVEYKGQWYAFYHNSSLSGNNVLRSICVDKLFYESDNIRIKPVKQTKGAGSPWREEGPFPIAGVIDAIDYNNGGQGFAYWDKTAVNVPGQYRPSESVDIDYDYMNDDFFVSQTETGEYINYTVNVTQSGWYDIDCIAVSPDSKNGELQLAFDDVNIEKVTVPLGYRLDFKTTTIPQVFLTEGTQVMTVYPFGSINIKRFIFHLKTADIQQTPDDSSFSIHPEGNGIFMLQLLQPAQIALADINGRILYFEQVEYNASRIDFSHLATGVYILNIKMNDRIFRSKLTR